MNNKLTIINEKRVIEVIGRMIGRAISHQNAAFQTNDEKKKQAHLTAYNDLMSLADDLAESTNDPDSAKTNKSYKWATNSI